MKRSNPISLWMLVSLLLIGCAAATPVVEKSVIPPPSPVEVPAPPAQPEPAAVREETPAPAPAEPATPPGSAEEEQAFNLFSGGVDLLAGGDAAKAGELFTTLVDRYPQSRWRRAAEAFIRLIDEGLADRETGRSERLATDQIQKERDAALHERDQLRKATQELSERCQGEMAALQQENEQLKKDLQRLKSLEIELEKRERMLR